MNLELSLEEAQFLKDHLERLLHEIDFELIRTDKRELQHALALEEARLQQLQLRVEQLIDRGEEQLVDRGEPGA